MVFIHGGAYILGTTATPLYDGSALARTQDVVVVTVQYRFGPFGYLDFSSYSTDERTFDSNVGIRDHLAALEWVQRNIAAFGGDPGNVTIFGESAGGSAVLALLASPARRGCSTRRSPRVPRRSWSSKPPTHASTPMRSCESWKAPSTGRAHATRSRSPSSGPGNC